MDAKVMNLPKCFNFIKKVTSQDNYERILYNFYKSRNYSSKDIKNILYLYDKEILRNLSLDEKCLVKNYSIITCCNLEKNYKFDKYLCVNCDFNKQQPNSINYLPLNIKESLILNMAQQNNQVLQAINPDKFISTTEIGGKYVNVYKEFYYYLKKESTLYDKDILNIMSKIFYANEEMPANIKDVNSLMEYIFEDKVHEIKLLIKNFRRPFKIERLNDMQLQSHLTTTKYIALEISNDGRFLMYSENSTNVYDINLQDSELVEYLNKILTNRGVKTIVKNIETHNILIQRKLKVTNLIPMDIVYSSLNISNKKNLNYENLINEFLKYEKEVDKKLLAFIKFSLNTNLIIKVEDTKDGFYKIKTLQENDNSDNTEGSKSIIIEFYINQIIDSLNEKNISYKEFYYNLACFINRYTNNCKYSKYIKFNVIEISDKLTLSANEDVEIYVFELFMVAFRKVARSLSSNPITIFLKG